MNKNVVLRLERWILMKISSENTWWAHLSSKMQKTSDGSNCGATVIEVLPLRRRLIRGFMLVTTNEKGSRVIAENARHKEMRRQELYSFFCFSISRTKMPHVAKNEVSPIMHMCTTLREWDVPRGALFKPRKHCEEKCCHKRRGNVAEATQSRTRKRPFSSDLQDSLLGFVFDLAPATGGFIFAN